MIRLAAFILSLILPCSALVVAVTSDFSDTFCKICYFYALFEEDFKKNSCCTGMKGLCRSLANGNRTPGCHKCRSQKSALPATLMGSRGKHEHWQHEQECTFLSLFQGTLAELCLLLFTQRSRYLIRHLVTLFLQRALEA